MKQSHRALLSTITARSNAFLTRLTSKSDLNALIGALHPRPSTAPLIRLGPNSDGGYLVPDDLNGIGACYSPGVGDIAGFEADCAKHGMQVFMADASVDRPPTQDPAFHFTKRFLASVSNEHCMTLDEWIANTNTSPALDLMLQIDIEGAEYEVFISSPQSLLQRFRFIVAEFHNLDYLFDSAFFSIAKAAFYKLLTSHTCVHIHPNNCCGSASINGITIPRVMEFTFARNDRIARGAYVDTLPNMLDFDNTSNKPIKLPHCWYDTHTTNRDVTTGIVTAHKT